MRVVSVAAANVLLEARELLCNEGWLQNAECKDVPGIGMQYCSLGAILKAAGELKLFKSKDENGVPKLAFRRPNWHNLSEVADEAISILAHQLGEKFEPLKDFAWCAVEDFNDDKERTFEQVLAAFDRAIEVAKQQP